MCGGRPRERSQARTHLRPAGASRLRPHPAAGTVTASAMDAASSTRYPPMSRASRYSSRVSASPSGKDEWNWAFRSFNGLGFLGAEHCTEVRRRSRALGNHRLPCVCPDRRPGSRFDLRSRSGGGRGGGFVRLAHKDAPVAQLDRAPGFESVGRGFESLRARQLDLTVGEHELAHGRPASLRGDVSTVILTRP